jgi:hypothetical protein
MLIECILHRDGGTFADVDGHEYHFKPLETNLENHVAEVTDEHAIKVFLAIPEGYQPYFSVVLEEDSFESVEDLLNGTLREIYPKIDRMTDFELIGTMEAESLGKNRQRLIERFLGEIEERGIGGINV